MGKISRQKGIEDVFSDRPHVVVLGAGASIAAMSQDRNGRPLPDMRGLESLPEIGELFRSAGITDAHGDFEAAYSRLRASGQFGEVGDQIDQIVWDYFAGIEIGDEPTIYDHLLLGLRSKDLVASFNWDPLIVQAELRLRAMGVADLPQVVFLHGNVAITACMEHRVQGNVGDSCPGCEATTEPVPLLYPVTKKNYEENPFIAYAWHALRWGLKYARIVTIFGYSAPQTDLAAIKEFKTAWGTPEKRQFEQFEFIVRPGSNHEGTRDRWDDFVHTHHYRIRDDFYDSRIALNPRRTDERFIRQHVDAHFVDVNPIPRDTDLETTIAWFRELMEYEQAVEPKASEG